MTKNPAQQLLDHGQSVWYDNISRELLANGELKRLVTEWGVRGLTSNPTIFDQAISSSTVYDAAIAELKSQNAAPETVFEQLATEDIANAADVLRSVYDESGGNDGFVSIEVSPLIASDTQATIGEGRKLFEKLSRPNIMIKVPGTAEGLPAVKALLEDGVNVNVTLLFSGDNYAAVARTYCEALEARLDHGLAVDKIRSVASFFVSRVDTIVDKALSEIIEKQPDKAEIAQSLLGQFAVANSRLAYKKYKEIFEGSEFKELREAGAHAQRPLWASTGTKNPAYSDIVYIDSLIGPNTVNTVPHKTLAAFVDHGTVEPTLDQNMAHAERVARQLTEIGVDVEALLEELQVDGVKKFADSFRSLNETIAKKMA